MSPHPQLCRGHLWQPVRAIGQRGIAVPAAIAAAGRAGLFPVASGHDHDSVGTGCDVHQTLGQAADRPPRLSAHPDRQHAAAGQPDRQFGDHRRADFDCVVAAAPEPASSEEPHPAKDNITKPNAKVKFFVSVFIENPFFSYLNYRALKIKDSLT